MRSVTRCFARGGERATDPQASYLNISSLARAAPASDQPDSSTSRRPASGRQIRKRTTNRSYAANASSLLAIKVFQGVLRGPRNLGTLLHIHQTRRSRDAPDVLPAYSSSTAVFQPSYVQYTPYGLLYPPELVQGPNQAASSAPARCRARYASSRASTSSRDVIWNNWIRNARPPGRPLVYHPRCFLNSIKDRFGLSS